MNIDRPWAAKRVNDGVEAAFIRVHLCLKISCRPKPDPWPDVCVRHFLSSRYGRSALLGSVVDNAEANPLRSYPARQRSRAQTISQLVSLSYNTGSVPVRVLPCCQPSHAAF